MVSVFQGWAEMIEGNGRCCGRGSCLLWLPSFPVLPLYIFQLQMGEDNGEHKYQFIPLSQTQTQSSPCRLHFQIALPQVPNCLGHTLPMRVNHRLKECGSRAALCLRGESTALIIPDPKEMFPPTNTCLSTRVTPCPQERSQQLLNENLSPAEQLRI